MADDLSIQPGKVIPLPQGQLCFGPFRFDMAALRLCRSDVEVHLAPKAAAVLEILLARRGTTVGKEVFFDTVWEGTYVSDESLTQTISTIRRSLGDVAHSPDYIQTVPGKGYRFIAEASVGAEHARAQIREAPPLPQPAPQPAIQSHETTSNRRRRPLVLPWVVAAAALIMAGGAWIAGPGAETTSTSRRTTRFTEHLPAGHRLHVGVETGRRWGANPNFIALSPDGNHLAYMAQDAAGAQHVYLRPLDADESVARPVPGSEGARAPFFSRDSQWLGFNSGGQLYRVPITGGLPQPICDGSNGGASWGPNNAIAYNPVSWSGISITKTAGGTAPQPLTTIDTNRRENGHKDPVFLPDGSAILYTNWLGGGRDEDSVSATVLATGETKVVLERASGARYLEPGYLAFVREGQLQVQAFDPETLEVSGTPVAFYETERGLYDASPSGDLAYIPMPRTRVESEVVWVDQTGAETPIVIADHIALQPAVSPDGKRLAVSQVEPDGKQHIWVLDAAGHAAPVQVTFDGNSAVPEWSSDGKWVFYNSDQGGPWETFRVLADGTGKPELLIEGDSLPYHWHPTLPHVAYRTDNDIWIVDLDATEGRRRLLEEDGKQGSAKFSPDGNWLLYTSDVEGENEIFVRSYPDLAKRIKVSRGGGQSARWARDGNTIFYASGDQMMAASVHYEPEFWADVPRELFSLEPYARPTGGSDYDVGPGDRFVMVKTVEEPVRTEITVVLNWVKEVKKLIPPGGRQPGR